MKAGKAWSVGRRLVSAAVAFAAVGAVGAAAPASAHERPDRTLSGTGTLLFVGAPRSTQSNPDGSFVVTDLPAAGTMHLVRDDVTIDASFSGADTLSGTASRFTITGTRRYEVVVVDGHPGRPRRLRCAGAAAGTAPNQVGGGEFTERLRCTHGVDVTLHVVDVSPIVVGGQFAGWNRTVTASVDD